jgi:GTPase SAR1 family protein
MRHTLHAALSRFNNAHLSFPPFAQALREIGELHQMYRETGLAENLLILGESGTGKTTLCRAVIQQHPRQILPDRDWIPVFYVPIPPAATIAGVTEAMLSKLGDPAPTKGTVSAKTARIFKLAKGCGVELILLDEAQHIQDRGRLPTQYMVGDWLKGMADEIAVPTVLLGLPRVDSLLRVNEQLRRRFTRRLFMNLGQNEESSIETECFQLFTSLLPSLPVPLHCGDYDWKEFGYRLYYATDGRIAYVKSLLSAALRWVVQHDLAAISPKELEAAFACEIWSAGIGSLNPFNEKFAFRPLTRAGEPFEQGIPGPSQGGKRHVAA